MKLEVEQLELSTTSVKNSLTIQNLFKSLYFTR